MLLITIEEVTTFEKKGETDRHRHTHYEHVLTCKSLLEVIAYYGRKIKGMCQRFDEVGMGGWFSVIQVTEVNPPTLESILVMQSRYFGGYFLDDDYQSIPFDLVTEAMRAGGGSSLDQSSGG